MTIGVPTRGHVAQQGVVGHVGGGDLERRDAVVDEPVDADRVPRGAHRPRCRRRGSGRRPRRAGRPRGCTSRGGRGCTADRGPRRPSRTRPGGRATPCRAAGTSRCRRRPRRTGRPAAWRATTSPWWLMPISEISSAGESASTTWRPMRSSSARLIAMATRWSRSSTSGDVVDAGAEGVRDLGRAAADRQAARTTVLAASRAGTSTVEAGRAADPATEVAVGQHAVEVAVASRRGRSPGPCWR